MHAPFRANAGPFVLLEREGNVQLAPSANRRQTADYEAGKASLDHQWSAFESPTRPKKSAGYMANA
jgi:hypothetical protein